MDSAELPGDRDARNRQRADEALPMSALATGADLVVAEDDMPVADGIGVLRRHPQ